MRDESYVEANAGGERSKAQRTKSGIYVGRTSLEVCFFAPRLSQHSDSVWHASASRRGLYHEKAAKRWSPLSTEQTAQGNTQISGMPLVVVSERVALIGHVSRWRQSWRES